MGPGSGGSRQRARLDAAARTLEAWRRRKRDTGERLVPEDVWEAAVQAAADVGLAEACKVLHLNHTDLKLRLAAHNAERSSVAATRGEARFVELPPPAVAAVAAVAARPPHELTVEVVSTEGAKLTVRMLSAASLDVVGLVREFAGRTP